MNFVKFPTVKGLLKALELSIYNFPVLVLTAIFARYYQVYGYQLFVGKESHIPYYLVGGVISVFCFSSFIYALIFDFFWGKHDEPKTLKILPPKSSLIEGCIMTIFAWVANVLACVIMFPFIPQFEAYELGYRLGRYFLSDIEIRRFTFFFGLVWIVIVSYQYSWRRKK